ncbi:hypothetical protein Y1Q_0019643 [Alligator mississippiensis]|uniref:Uncharacterized protein n=1 Tax=Alligator mississippiensis TaxID=8496 RepID=A0A151PEH5_ALLMI|nr:hypothetical protein Y1Q_0019643 [Alligator mississippiensis]
MEPQTIDPLCCIRVAALKKQFEKEKILGDPKVLKVFLGSMTHTTAACKSVPTTRCQTIATVAMGYP